jgi:phage gpG-like protein
VNVYELPAYLEEIRARVEASAVPVVDAIASTYEEHLVGFTLRESGAHPPVTQTPAPPGRPPAFMTGELAGSVTRTPGAGDGGSAEASVAPHTIYAATQEFGGVHHGSPFMWLWLRYIGPEAVRRRGWRKEVVDIPARPYMSTAVDETIENGSLVRAAEDRFSAVVWGE